MANPPNNTFRLKRRQGGNAGAPSSLQNAEPAYNEVDDTLYYGKGTNPDGSATNIIPIGGTGAFVARSGDQSVGGVKTFGSSPLAPTPSTDDNSKKVATTEYVKNVTAPVARPANTVLAGPVSGAAPAYPTFRQLVEDDIPMIHASKVTDFIAAVLQQIAGQAGLTICPLDGNKLIPAAFLPSYVDDVLEFASLSQLPATGEKGKIYVTLDSNYEYRWGGSSYIRLVASPGSTDEVAEGMVNLYFSQARVLATILKDFAAAGDVVLASTDTLLQGLQKLQGQVSARLKIANNLSDLTNLIAARSNLGLGSMAVQNSDNVSITGGAISGITLDGGTF